MVLGHNALCVLGNPHSCFFVGTVSQEKALMWCDTIKLLRPALQGSTLARDQPRQQLLSCLPILWACSGHGRPHRCSLPVLLPPHPCSQSPGGPPRGHPLDQTHWLQGTRAALQGFSLTQTEVLGTARLAVSPQLLDKPWLMLPLLPAHCNAVKHIAWGVLRTECV